METRRRSIAEDGLTNKSCRQAETSENGRENSLPIPIELITEIFSRLPLKSIAKCRCVSKPWASALRRPDFTELFLSRSWARPKLLFACQKKGELFFFSAPQPQNPDEKSSPVVVDYHMKLSFDGCCEIRGLVHGFVGVINNRVSKGKKETVPVICNPSTGQSFPLPKAKTRRVKVTSLFGYDPIGKQFKVLSMTRRTLESEPEELQVLTLGTGNLSWRMIECCIPSYYYPLGEEICINGVLYYGSFCRCTSTVIISCFEVRSEKLSFIKFKNRDTTMVNYNGKLGLIGVGEGENGLDASTRSIKLRVLEDLERQEWSEHTYLLPPLWENVVGKTWLSFVGVIGTNEIVMKSHYATDPPYLFYFNIERNTIVRVEVQGMDVSKCNSVRIFLDHTEDVKLM